MIYSCIDDFLDVNNDHMVSYIVSNIGGLTLVKNCLLSAQKNNVKLVLFALDEEISQTIEKDFSIEIVLFLANLKKDFTYTYGSFEWIDVVYNRYFIAHRLMKEGRNIVYLDTDVLINKDYTLDIKRRLRQNNIIIQSNGINCCTGFFAMKSTPKLIQFFNKKKMESKEYRKFGGNGGASDQKFFNHYIGENMNEFNCVLLDRDYYPNGQHYYDNHQEIEEKCYIIHFNCMQGEEKKIKRMKLYNKFYITPLHI